MRTIATTLHSTREVERHNYSGNEVKRTWRDGRKSVTRRNPGGGYHGERGQPPCGHARHSPILLTLFDAMLFYRHHVGYFDMNY